MNAKQISFTIIGIFILSMGSCWISANNSEVTLKNKLIAQKKDVEAYYDKVWKIIKQKAQVAEKYKETFKEIYPDLIEGRYGNEKGGTLFKFIQESNPNFDVNLYKSLMQSIEAERNGFFMEQKLLIDLNNQHHTLRETFPNSIFIGGRPDVPIKIVTSSATQKVMESGKEDNVDVF